ncbi:CLUMA_CG008089, isoform A [Clunio marinus]|uniref:CLUMA_CG008089, isoform A n=1 Tax=Clunio marinus TaxID=568069 RepID=A0A1J1I2S9_9DIPT|nr:CLUMA_CG008089, isoform A [Clunio marinus]
MNFKWHSLTYKLRQQEIFFLLERQNLFIEPQRKSKNRKTNIDPENKVSERTTSRISGFSVSRPMPRFLKRKTAENSDSPTQTFTRGIQC